MKKNRNKSNQKQKKCYQYGRLIPKLLIVILYCIISLHGTAQNQGINLTVKHKSLHEVLMEIKQQSGKNMVYNNNLIDKYTNESFVLKNVTLHQALTKVLQDKNLKFKIQNNVIIIEPEETKKQNVKKTRELTQTLKGKVVDAESQSPLVGANVVVLETNPVFGTITDTDGSYIIENVPIGRHKIQFSFIGYQDKTIPEILLTSGKERVVNVGLKEAVTDLDEVTVSYKFHKDQPLNTMASVSARSFSVEETRRYAGGLDDPARLASAFAGVTMSSIQDNGLVVRGNSTKGILWRLEGINIPNPNHFPEFGVAGGGFVTVFSSQMLANSDFYTGAFPAEYGNALAGVFDMKFRTGNSEKREHTFQAGFIGLDIASEGPFKKGEKATYLFNYRYSTFGLLSALVPDDLPMPKYQDVSFKLHFPNKHGSISIWGIGSADEEWLSPKDDTTKWETIGDRIGLDWKNKMGAIGLSHKLLINKNTYLKTTVAGTGTLNRIKMSILDDELIEKPHTDITDNSGKIIVGSRLNHKLNRKISLKTGFNYYEWLYNLEISSTLNDIPSTFQNFVNENGNSRYIEYFAQGKYYATSNFILYGGLNSLFFDLNKTFSIDPRFSLKWNLHPKHSLGFGFGKHSQLEELKIYMIQKNSNGQTSYPNKDLELSKAIHLVFAYDWLINQHLRLKIEPYYQYLYDIPGKAGSYYSLINFTQDYTFREALENNSKGRNIGIDVTLERFLDNGYYFLVTSSVFNSQYAGNDGVWRNTKFNKSFVSNLLFGKEFITAKKAIWGINGRLIVMGGERFTPVRMDKSLQEKTIYYDYSKAYQEQMPASAYLDLTFTYRRNKPKYSTVWALQIKNALGTPFYTGYEYNYKTATIKNQESVQILPVISYKIEF